MKVIAFGASTSKTSINKIFANYVAQNISKNYELLDLNDYLLPLYSTDYETENGLPENSTKFLAKIKEADLIVISLAEHNGSYTAAFKNLFDWLSRNEGKFLIDKKVLLTSTAPGARGGKGVLEEALNRFPRHGANVIGHFTLPQFQDNFNLEKGIINEELNQQFNRFIESLNIFA